MAAPSTGVTWVNSGLAVLIRSDRAGGLEEPTAEPYPRAVLKDVGGARAGGGVMTNHPTSSSGLEEAARAGAAPPPTGRRHGPPTSNREAATQAAWRDTALLSIGRLRTETLRYRSASTNSRSRSPSSTPTTTNCAANSLQSASSGTHSARRR